jgi:hypothetical protein
MNRLKTIGLFAGIFAITMGAISLSDTSESFFMVSTIPQSQENVGMLGHVEYTVRDTSDNIKSYMQTDNIVTTQGKDCVAQGMFDSGETVDQCTSGTALFNYIAIGNHTTGGVPVNTLTALEVSDSGCADSGTDGEMARKLIDPTFVSTGSSTVVTLDTVDSFDFDLSNATIVMQSGVFNADETAANVFGECTTVGTADMFAVQDLNLDAGITVSDGDSLSVKWTITVG